MVNRQYVVDLDDAGWSELPVVGRPVNNQTKGRFIGEESMTHDRKVVGLRAIASSPQAAQPSSRRQAPNEPIRLLISPF
jgi:hypothetical protein